MSTTLFHQATFMLSAAHANQLPSCNGAFEVAFAGRSNAGKSSAINLLCRRRNLARTSKTPGRTRLINIFALDEYRRLVDLPGYGYAKVQQSVRLEWQGLLAGYIEQRTCLKGVVTLMDCRHPLRTLDIQLLDWCTQLKRPLHILLTKSDKLSKSKAQSLLIQVSKQVKIYPDCSVQLFSTLKRNGINALEAKLLEWLEIESHNSV